MERKTRNRGSGGTPSGGQDGQTYLPAPTPAGIGRRRAIFAETLGLRESIGPSDLSAEELLSEEHEVDR